MECRCIRQLVSSWQLDNRPTQWDQCQSAAVSGSNTYAGGTTINSGTLNVVADAALGDPSYPVIVNGGGLQIGANLSSARNININAGIGIDTSDFNATFAGILSGSGGITKF